MEALNRDVSGLSLPPRLLTFMQEDWGISELHPPQAQAIPSILEGRNTLAAIPTASGKSLLAYMGMAKRLSEGHERSKAIYIVPLKALAMEKYEDLVELGKLHGLACGSWHW